MSQVVGSNNSYKPITNTTWVRARLCKLQKGCTRLAAASDKVYQLLAQGRWFSPGTPASSTTKAGRHDIAEILLKVALKHQKSINQSYTKFLVLENANQNLLSPMAEILFTTFNTTSTCETSCVGPHREHLCKVWLNSVQWFSRRR